jgi:Ca2+-binding RTX toxin-like protein
MFDDSEFVAGQVTQPGWLKPFLTRLVIPAHQESGVSRASAGTTISAMSAGNTITGTSGNDLIDATHGIGGQFATAADDTISGLAGNDTIDGAAGADSMVGGTGNDIFIVRDAGDIADETGGATADRDTVKSYVSFSLADATRVKGNVEYLTLLGGGAISGTGNALANLMDGSQNTAANTLKGLGGNDTYVLGAGDVADETGGAAADRDTIQVDFSFSLSDSAHVIGSIEYLTLLGSAAITGTGNASGNLLDASRNPAANTLYGLAGNDLYMLGAGDSAVEASGGGTDTVKTAFAHTLEAEIENIILTNASGSVTVSGNRLANTLDGTQGAGVARFYGGGGDDTYLLGDGDQAIENATGAFSGDDLVILKAEFNYVLPSNIERVQIGYDDGGGVHIDGNALDNTFYLQGVDGYQTVDGLAGNDTYFLGINLMSHETVSESISGAAGGRDTVYAQGPYSLGANIEDLVIDFGTGRGNELNNNISVDMILSLGATLEGLAGDDTLAGGRYEDRLVGGLGSDVLTGVDGSQFPNQPSEPKEDVFVFNATLGPTNVDTIQDFAHAVDKIELDDAVMTTLGAWSVGKFHSQASGHAADADDRIIYDRLSGSLWYDADGTGGVAAVKFAILTSSPADLDWTDFQIG